MVVVNVDRLIPLVELFRTDQISLKVSFLYIVATDRWVGMLLVDFHIFHFFVTRRLLKEIWSCPAYLIDDIVTEKLFIPGMMPLYPILFFPSAHT